MPHYAGGEVVQVGYLARGTLDDGREFIGSVIEVYPDADACNVVLVRGGRPVRAAGLIALDGATTDTRTAKDLDLVSRHEWVEAREREDEGEGAEALDGPTDEIEEQPDAVGAGASEDIATGTTGG